MTTANLVDVSQWQPTTIDWDNLKSNGIKAVIVRIGHGTTQDKNASAHIANATKAGLVVHAYHYYEGVSGELNFTISNAKSLGITANTYYFLDMEGEISGSWPDIFRSYYQAWQTEGWKAGLYCSLSNYSKFDNDELVKNGVYRWIAAWGSNQPANADLWQFDSKTGLGNYTDALDKDVDISGKLLVSPQKKEVTYTDPNGDYQLKAGAFVGIARSTTKLQGGPMLVASPDGKNKIPKLTPLGNFLFNDADGDAMWQLIEPKIGKVKGEKGDTGPQGPAGKDGQTWQPYIASDGNWHVKLIDGTDVAQSVIGVLTSGDADVLTTNDSYRVDGSLSNCPSNEGLLTVRNSNSEVWQTFIDSSTSDYYVRSRHNNVWTSWRQVTQWN